MKNSLEKAALEYYDRGFSVIPLRQSDKIPIIKNWTRYSVARAKREDVLAWWRQNSSYNIGIACGESNGRFLFVVDQDVEKDKKGNPILNDDGSFSQCGDISGCPATLSQTTGSGGKQLFYWAPAGYVVSNHVGIRPFVDVRGTGGQVVVAPSIHPNGKRYEWNFEELNPLNIAEFPKEELDAFLGTNISTRPKKWEQAISGVTQGSRNDTAASMVGKIIHDLDPALWETVGWDGFAGWNNKNTPPLGHLELRSVWESIKSRKLKEIVDTNPDNFKSLYREKETKKIGAYNIAKFLAEHHHIKTTDERVREIYHYHDGTYSTGGNVIGAEIQKILEDLCTNNGKAEIIEKIKDFTLTKRDTFVVDEHLINLENGVYDLLTNTFLNHSPEHLFLNKIPTTYDPNADCPKIKTFLSDVLEPKYILVVQEWAGYLLYRKYFLKKAVIFVGEPNTGKTTLISLLTKFIGEANVSGASLQRISTDKFATSQLYAKHMNIYDDLSANDINDNGVFKMVTGGGYITGEYKFGNQFSFQNYAKLTFACNKIPSVADTNDEAYFSRWLIIPFNNQISKQNSFLLDEITSQEELSGFLNFALEGLHRLLRTRSFSYSKDPDAIKTEMLRSGSPIANFAYDCLIEGLEGADSWVSKEVMYEAFATYAREEKLPTMTIQGFGKKLPKYATYISDGKSGVYDPSKTKTVLVTGWRNVTLKSQQDHQGNQGINEILSRESEEQFNSL